MSCVSFCQLKCTKKLQTSICWAAEGQQCLCRCKSLAQAVSRSLEKGEAMPHPTGWTSLCARTAQPGPTGSVSPEQPATAVRRLSTSGCWKGMVGLFCVFDRFSSSSLSLLCPRVTPDPLSFLQSQGRWDGACSSLLPVPRCAVQMGLQGGMGSGC